MKENVALLWLLALPMGASPVVYLIGRLSYRGTRGLLALARWACLAALFLTWIPLFFAGRGVILGNPVMIKIGREVMQMDGIGLLLSVTVLLLGTLVTIFSMPYMNGEEGEEKFYALLPALCASMIGLGCARDLFNLWVWFEAMAITSYLLVAFYRDQKGSLEAGIKYLVQSAVGSLFVLLGIAMVFLQAGTLDLAELRGQLEGIGPLGMAAGTLFLVGFGIKTALVPLHTWLPDAHSQAPSGISAMLSGVVIESGLVALLRTLGILSASATAWGALILFFGVLNMVIGNLMALRQTQLKRMLAYSSVAQVGYMLIGFGVTAAYGLSNGALGGFFHLFNHAVMKGLAFLAAGSLIYALYLARGKHDPLVLDDLNGAAQRYPLTAFALSVAVLGLGGLPPLSGFMSKWQIFLSGAETRSTALLWLVIFAGLNSVLSLGYYAPLVNRMYRRQPSEAVKQGKPISVLMALPMVVMVLLTVILGLWPAWISWLTGPAAGSLLLAFGF
jgi:proton-translocating NADH-quinone oxidoreductase chain N